MISAKFVTAPLIGQMNEAEKVIRKATAAAVWKGALQALRIARRSILKGPKTGETYGVYRAIKSGKNKGKMKRKLHRASAPGEAPANDLGNLADARSLFVVKPDRGARFPVAYLVAAAPYAKALEYGSRHIEPRPFLNPAANAVRPFIVSEIKRILAQGGNNGGKSGGKK